MALASPYSGLKFSIPNLEKKVKSEQNRSVVREDRL